MSYKPLTMVRITLSLAVIFLATSCAPTKIVKPDIVLVNGKKMSRMHYESFKLPSKERSKVRSKFYTGIAKAMADQWGNNG